LFGVYHFARPDLNNTAKAEADWFVQSAGTYIGPGHLPPAVDVEGTALSVGQSVLTTWVKDFDDEVQRLTNVRPILYASSGNLGVINQDPAQTGLWVADYPYVGDYGDLRPSVTPKTGAWTSYNFWQYSSKTTVPGITGNVDGDVFHGTLADLQALAGAGVSIPPAPTLSGPADQATGVPATPAFSWSSVTGATSGYRLIVATNQADLPTSPGATAGTGPSVVINQATTATSFTPGIPLDAGKTYYWEVHGGAPGVGGYWSKVFSFTTAAVAAKPDFHPTLVDAPNTGTIGSTVNVVTQVGDLGAASGSYVIAYRLFIEGTGSYYALKTVTRSAGIAANSTDSWTESVTIPSYIPAGTYRMNVYVDPALVIDESNEGNNDLFDTNTIVISAAVVSKQEQLGKMLLGAAYTGVSLDYDVYYANGPTGSNTYGGWHPGIDYYAPLGTTVYSPVKGVVDSFDAEGTGYGRLSIKIDGTNDYFIFLHLSKLSVSKGQYINVGDVIGKSGKTSPDSIGPHLHVELRTGTPLAAWYFTSLTATGVNKNPTSILG
jgi:hypothetical protein